MRKKKERAKNSYRIEQLGPRLMMDATVSDWQDDLDNLDTSAATYIVNESETLKQKEFLNISWNDENGSRYAKIDDLLWGSEFSQLNWGNLYNSVKRGIQAKLGDVSSGSTLLSASDIASAIGNGSVSVQTGMLDHKIGRFTVGDSYIANYSAYAENNLLKIEIDGLTCIDTDKDLGNDKLSVDITDYGVETNFSSVGNRYSISTGWILSLDGNINNNTQDSAKARFAIETAFEQDSNDAVRFGILDLTGDQDENEDLIIRKELLIDATGGISEADKIQLDLSLKIAEYANDFTNMNGLSENVHLYKSFDDASLVSSNPVQSFTNISMGKILGKLQELSSKLSKINSDVDFGGLLAQNANAILNLSKMLESILKSTPQSLQELVGAINASEYSVNHSSKISLNSSGELVIPFNLQMGSQGTGTSEASVSLMKSKLEELLNVKVTQNDSVALVSTANLAFDLAVPLVDSAKADKNNSLTDIGLPSDANMLGSIVGTDMVMASEMNHEFENSISSNVSLPSGSGWNICIDEEKHIYAFYTEDAQKELPAETRNVDEMRNIVKRKGFVLPISVDDDEEITLKYDGRKIDVAGIEGLVSALNSIFDQDPTFSKVEGDYKSYAIALGETLFILVGEKVDLSKMDKSIDICGISDPYKNESVRYIWLSNEMPPEKGPEGVDVRFEIEVDGVSKMIDFESGYFDDALCVADIAKSIQAKINKAFGWGDSGTNVPLLHVDVRDGKMAVYSSKSFVFDFGSTNVAEWLGFSKRIVTNADSNAKACMEILVDGVIDPIAIDLTGLNLGSVTIGEVLDEIVSQSNGILRRNLDNDLMLECVSSSCSIKEIRDINGYGIAAALGLSGSVENKRRGFEVKAKVKESSQSSEEKARFENLSLTINHSISDGDVDVKANYGVFGINIVGDLRGMGCAILCSLDQNNNFVSNLTYNLGDSRKLDVNFAENIQGKLQELSVITDSGLIEWIPSYLIEGANPYFGFPKKTITGDEIGLSMDKVSGLLAETVSKSLTNYFFSHTEENTFHAAEALYENIDLPLQGKNVLELMGLRSKLSEMGNAFAKGAKANLQEISDYFKRVLDVELSFSFSTAGIGVDIQWHKKSLQQVTELGGMDFEIEGFRLGGSIEAYLDVDLTLVAHIDIAYSNGMYAAVLNKSSNKPALTGHVSVRATNIVSDVNVTVKDGELSKQVLLQAGKSTADTSFMHMRATISANSIDLQLGGKLNLSKNGENVGCLLLGIADAQGSISYWNAFENGGGLLHCSANSTLAASAVWNGDGAPVMMRSSTGNIQEGDVLIDLRGITASFEKVELFEKLRSVADGFSDTMRLVQSNLNRIVLQENLQSIPFIGDSIINISDCISCIDSDFVEPFRNYVYKAQNLDALAVAVKLREILGKKEGFLFALDDCSGTGNSQYWAQKLFDRYYDGVQFLESDDEACWRVRLHGLYTLDANANFDLGYPGLGLRADGGVEVCLEWTLDIGFGISKTEGAFLLLSNGYEQEGLAASNFVKEETSDWHIGDDLKINVVVRQKDNSSIKGSLGFLTMVASNSNASNPLLDLKFGVDLNDGSNGSVDAEEDWNTDKSAFASINAGNLRSGLSLEAGLRGGVNLDLNLTLGFGGVDNNESNFPSISTDFVFEWNSDFGSFEGTPKKVAFEDISFNCVDFINKTLSPIIEKIEDVLSPIRPLIDFLQAEIPVLNKLPAGGIHITVLDLIKQYGDAKGYDFRMIDDIIELNNVAQKLNGLSDKGIKVDDWVIYDSSKVDYESRNDLGLSYLNGMIADKEKFVDEIAGNFFDTTLWENLSNYTNSNGIELTATEQNHLRSMVSQFSSDEYGWSFPILDDSAKVIYGMLMGNHADLVKFNMHPLEIDFDWSKSFAIVGPLCADIGFNFDVCIDLAFGYDTYGLESWAGSGFKDVGSLVDGFYVSDWNDAGKDVSEVIFHSGIIAGASVAGRVGIDAGINLNVDMDFIDPNADGKIRLGEIADMFSMGMFDFSADIAAKAYAYLDYFIGRKEWTLWSSGTFDVFESANEERNPVLATKQGNDLVVNIGEYAAKRNAGDLSDGNDTVTIEFTEGNKCEITYGDNTGSFDVTGTLFIYAGKGNDNVTITGTACCNVEIHGGAGNDQIDLSGLSFSGEQYAVIFGDGGNDLIKGASGTSFIFGEGGRFKVETNETVAESYPTDKSSGNNVIVASGGKNYIFGGFGNDFIVGGNGEDYIFGDGGRVTIGAATAQGNKDNTSYDRYGLFDEGGDDAIFGGDGDDVLLSGAGADTIDGGAGADEIHAGMGNDIVYGGSGTDRIYGDDGVDIVFGDKPADAAMTIAGDAAQGVLPYAYVSDELKKDGSLLKDSESIKLFDFATKFGAVNTGNALTTEQQSAIGGYVNGVADNGSMGNDEIYGGNGSDIIFGDDGADGASALGGNDVIEGGAGNDFIDGDAGDDRVTGGSGEDVLYGGQGNDILDGGAGNDIVFGDDGWADINSRGESGLFDNDADNLVFGYTLAGFVDNFGILPDATSVSSGGKDFIYAGNGSDVVDGQGSDDVVLVNFMGEFYQAYTNVFDSGSTFGDELAIEGTIADDDVLIRASDAGLGVVALLPVEGSDKSKLERVNFWKTEGRDEGVDIVSVDTGAGDDRITLDGTLSAIAIDSGAGDDEIFVGQQFDTERSAAGANVQAKDQFSTESTKAGHLSAGVQHATSITAGSGDDTITVLHTSAPLALSGKSGDDTFNIHLFVDEEGNPIMNGPVTVIGGTGEDLLNVVGSEGDDTFVYTSEGVSASGVAIQSISIESDRIYGGKGDDSFYLLSSRENQHVYMEGGDGNDSFYNGGVQTDEHYIEVENRDYRGHNGIIEHAVSSTSTAYASGPADSIGVNIIDNDNCPVEVLFTDAMGHITEPRLTLAEGGAYAEYYVRLSRALGQGETVTVTVFAPTVTRNDRLRGDAGVVFVNASGAEIGNSVTFTFTAGMGLGSNAHVRVKAKADLLREGDDHAALLHKVEYSGADTFEVGPVRNVLAFVDDRTTSVDTTRPFVVVDEFGVGTRSSSIELDNDSTVRLAYELADGTSAFYLTVENQVFTIHSEASRLNGEKYCYRAFGNQLVICCVDGDNVTPQSVSGILSAADGLTFATVADDANGLGTADDSLPGTVKIRHNDSSTDVAEGYTGSPTELYTDYYTITLNGSALAEGETVTVSINPALTPYAKNGEKIQQVEVYKILDDSGVAYTDLTQVVFDTGCFDALGNCRVYRVYVRAIDDSVTETDDLTLVPVGRNTIEHIHGTTHEDGGGSNGPELPEAKSMIRYSNASEGTLDDEQDPPVESDGTGEQEPFDETRSVDRVFVNNMDYTPDAASALHGLGETPVAGRSPSDSELLESDAESLRFTHSAIHATGMNLGNMEYGEFNLGTGADTVDISRSLYRDPGVDGENDFQKFTVINSGRGDDVIAVNSYQDGSDDQLVINAGEGDDTVTATGGSVTKDGLIVFGGLGDDTIEIGSDSSLVFGDRGQVLYHDDDGNVVTRLGDDRTGTPGVDGESGEWAAGGSDYATGKNKESEAYWQTDGERRGPSIARTVTEEQGGDDSISLASGENVVFGGVGDDAVTTGDGRDLVFGDDGYATFGGHASIAGALGQDNAPAVRTEATLGFNFIGYSREGLAPGDTAGASGYASSHWNNVGGSLAGTYGNDDREIVRFDDGTRASAVSVSYGGIESHRRTGTDTRINLQGYSHNFANASGDADSALMNSGLMTTAPSDQCDNRLEVVVDGLSQYFEHYSVVVYLDVPDSHSAAGHSVRKVSLYAGDDPTAPLSSYYVDDTDGSNFSGQYVRGTSMSLATAAYANYVEFELPAGLTPDSFRVVIEDGYTLDAINGKDLPGIAGIQVKGTLHPRDVSSSSAVSLGGDDVISTSGGADVVVGGAGADTIATFGDVSGGLYDGDVVFGDGATLVYTDRLGSGEPMLSSATSLDPDASEVQQGVSFDDRIVTGDGDDVVVGGLGSDVILSGSHSELTLDGLASSLLGEGSVSADLDASTVPSAIRDLQSLQDGSVSGLRVASINFTTRDAGPSTMASGTAGVVPDSNWNNVYLHNGSVYTREGGESSSTPVLRCSEGGEPRSDSGLGISISSYDVGSQDQGLFGSLVYRTSSELDGDTANGRIFAGYTAAQQQQEIRVTLSNLSQFRPSGGVCDVYVYLGADDSDTDAYSHIYEIVGSEDGSRYLNDWKGHAFDGDYREVTCTSRDTALSNLVDGAVPMVELIGNYVVFRGVSGDTFDVRIRNLHTGNGQWPMNMPVVTALQVVSGTASLAGVATGGDHDRDLVFGDSASLTFDMDVPYAADGDLGRFASMSRVVEASSVALDDALYALGADDRIDTGMDRDVVVAGEGSDTVSLGSGDDVGLGDNATLVLEHNNPVGVFRPDVETVLENHDYRGDTGPYLGSPGVSASQIQSKFGNGGVPGVVLDSSENGATDVFADATDKDWVLQQEEGTSGTEDPSGTDDPSGTEEPSGTVSRTVDLSSGAQVVSFAAGETVLLVSDNWPGKGNQWWNPNIVLIANGQGTPVPCLAWSWEDGDSTVVSNTQQGYYVNVDIPDEPNADGRYEIRVTAMAAGSAVISIG